MAREGKEIIHRRVFIAPEGNELDPEGPQRGPKSRAVDRARAVCSNFRAIELADGPSG
jgi:hypothetical protein